MACKRCKADPRPERFGDPRRCAFDEVGHFRDDNWRCATIDAILETVHDVDGCDESVQISVGRDYGGFLVFTRYKHRGRTSSLMHVGDFWPARVVTLDIAERWLDGTFWDASY